MKQPKRPSNAELDAGGNPACSSTKRQREEEQRDEKKIVEEGQGRGTSEGDDSDDGDSEVTIDPALPLPELMRQKRLLERNGYLLKMAKAAIKQSREAMTEDQDESQDVNFYVETEKEMRDLFTIANMQTALANAGWDNNRSSYIYKEDYAWIMWQLQQWDPTINYVRPGLVEWSFQWIEAERILPPDDQYPFERFQYLVKWHGLKVPQWVLATNVNAGAGQRKWEQAKGMVAAVKAIIDAGATRELVNGLKETIRQLFDEDRNEALRERVSHLLDNMPLPEEVAPEKAYHNAEYENKRREIELQSGGRVKNPTLTPALAKKCRNKANAKRRERLAEVAATYAPVFAENILRPLEELTPEMGAILSHALRPRATSEPLPPSRSQPPASPICTLSSSEDRTDAPRTTEQRETVQLSLQPTLRSFFSSPQKSEGDSLVIDDDWDKGGEKGGKIEGTYSPFYIGDLDDIVEKFGFIHRPILYFEGECVFERLPAEKPNVMEVEGDGHCAYRSLAIVFTGNGENADRMREVLMGELRKAALNKEPWVKDAVGERDPLVYAREHESALHGYWGGTVDFCVAANVFDANILVYSEPTGKPPVYTPHTPWKRKVDHTVILVASLKHFDVGYFGGFRVDDELDADDGRVRTPHIPPSPPLSSEAHCTVELRFSKAADSENAIDRYSRAVLRRKYPEPVTVNFTLKPKRTPIVASNRPSSSRQQATPPLILPTRLPPPRCIPRSRHVVPLSGVLESLPPELSPLPIRSSTPVNPWTYARDHFAQLRDHFNYHGSHPIDADVRRGAEGADYNEREDSGDPLILHLAGQLESARIAYQTEISAHQATRPPPAFGDNTGFSGYFGHIFIAPDCPDSSRKENRPMPNPPPRRTQLKLGNVFVDKWDAQRRLDWRRDVIERRNKLKGDLDFHLSIVSGTYFATGGDTSEELGEDEQREVSTNAKAEIQNQIVKLEMDFLNPPWAKKIQSHIEHGVTWLPKWIGQRAEKLASTRVKTWPTNFHPDAYLANWPENPNSTWVSNLLTPNPAKKLTLQHIFDNKIVFTCEGTTSEGARDTFFKLVEGETVVEHEEKAGRAIICEDWPCVLRCVTDKGVPTYTCYPVEFLVVVM